MQLQLDQWEVKDMELNPYKVERLWHTLQRHKTLFSDITSGDASNFILAIMSQNTMWFEVRERGILVGLIWFSDLHQVVDITAHMAFFDRRSFEKLNVCRQVVKWMFANMAIHRITVTPPAIYHATIKLLKRLGFVHEGTKREAVLIGGRWHDQLIFGITRSESEGM